MTEEGKREILVFGEKNFRITIPAEAKTTFAPFSPPTKDSHTWMSSGRAAGTLRVYESKSEKSPILAVFSGVFGFRDLSLGYAEEVAREEGATIWKDDEEGYVRETKVKGERKWVAPQLPAPATEEVF